MLISQSRHLLHIQMKSCKCISMLHSTRRRIESIDIYQWCRWTAIQTALLFIHFDWNRFIYIAIDRMMYLNNFIYSFNHFVSLCWKWMNYKFWPIVCDVCKWVKVCEEKFGIPVFGAALLHRRKLLLIHSTTITRIVSLTLSLSGGTSLRNSIDRHKKPDGAQVLNAKLRLTIPLIYGLTVISKRQS